MKDNLFKENLKDMEHIQLKHIHMRVILNKVYLMDKESTHGLQEVVMQEIIFLDKNMDMVFIVQYKVIDMKVIGKKGKGMVRAIKYPLQDKR